MAKRNLTLVVDEEVLRRARLRAVAEGRSVNDVVREQLTVYGGGEHGRSAAAAFLATAERVSRPRKSKERYRREDLYDRPVLR